MAPINGIPFLKYLLIWLGKYGIEKVILSVGYQWEIIAKEFGNRFDRIKIDYSIEKDPLGTGGAIVKAFESTESSSVLIVNGDSFFNINLIKFSNIFTINGCGILLALRHMTDISRYGTVTMDDSSRIIRFDEKQCVKNGLINTGIYIVEKKVISKITLPEKFSFEKDFLSYYLSEFKITGCTFNNFFIDIGIPSDYLIAQSKLPKIFAKYN